MRDHLRLLIFVAILPISLSYMVYYGFVSNLMGDIFSESGFSQIYDNGIFKYRVLGVGLLRLVHSTVSAWGLPTYAPEVLLIADADLSPSLYSSFFYMNTVLLALTMFVLFQIVATAARNNQSIPQDMILIIAIGMMTFGQYVVVPYDILSYLFLSTAIYVIICEPRKSWRRDLALFLIVALATLTRETATLILAFYATVHFRTLVPSRHHLLNFNYQQAILTILTATFLSIYVGLRAWLGGGEAVYRSFRIGINFTDNFSILGTAFFLSAIALALLDVRARRSSLIFMFLSSPYWLANFLIGNPRELRYWVPILLVLLLLQLFSRVNLPNRKTPDNDKLSLDS